MSSTRAPSKSAEVTAAVAMLLAFCLLVSRVACAAAAMPQRLAAPSGYEPLAQLARECAPGVHPMLIGRVATVESGGNPFAIGVVGGHLAHQPKKLGEALATVRSLESNGWNYSMGLIQVNKHNLARFGQTPQTMFDPCSNLRIGAAILRECYARALTVRLTGDAAVRAALSCYYSGDLARGSAYAMRVAASAPASEVVGERPIEVIPDVATERSKRSDSTATSKQSPQKAAKPAPHENWFMTWGDDDDGGGGAQTPRGYHSLSGSRTTQGGESNGY